MHRSGVLIGVWVLATAGATLVAWAAVSQVTREISPQAVLPLPRTAAIADVSASEQASDAAIAQTDEQEPAEPEDDARTEPQAATVSEAYDLVGGVVTVRYSGTSTTLVEASPESGFIAEVNDGGPGKVDVRFRSDNHESRLVTRIRDGKPDPQRDERPR